MKVQELLGAEFAMAHGTLDQVIALAGGQWLHKVPPGATVSTVAATYAHIAFAEDTLTNALAKGGAPLYVADGWDKKLGVAMPGPRQTPEWSESVRIEDLEGFREYARAVFAGTEQYLGEASDDEINRVIDTPITGKQPVGQLFGTLALWHVTSHQGEISALLGAQGQKGLPF